MKSLLQQLENESLLLLYMAGELPSEERDELEIMFERDGGLRSQLKLLQDAQSSSYAALAAQDAAQPLPSIDRPMRRINRSMQQWRIDQLARPPEAPAARSMMPLMAWSGGTAVAALLVFCIWWGFRGSDVSSHAQPGSGIAGTDNSIAQRTSSGDSGTNASPDFKQMEVVSVDSSPQRLGELESVVSEDFTRE
jgi:hypothetical protein